MSDLDSYSDASHGSPYLTTPPPAAREFHRARPRADPSSPGDDYHSARAANSVNESAASTVADDDAGVANEWARRVRSLFPTGELERGRKDDVALAENAIAAMRAWSSVSCTGGGTSSSSGRFELETSSSSPSEGDARARVARRAGRDRRTAEEGARDDAHRVGTSARARTACIVRRPRGRSFDDKSAWTE